MQFKGIRIYVVISAIIVTLAVLLAIQYAHQKFNVEEPLFKMYSQTKLVDKADLEDKGDTIKVVLHVKKTENLKKAYQDLTAQTQQVVGQNPFSLKLIDKRNPVLESAYYQSQFIIYEALAKGDFTKMADVIQQNADKIHAESRVYIDSDNIYVEFIKGDNYLYEIVARNNPAKDVTSVDGISYGTGSDQG